MTIPVTISGNTGFAGFTWEITCSESLEITRISKGSLLTQSDGGSLTVNLEKGLVNWNDCYNLEGDGAVLLLTIHIKEDAEPGAYAISLSQRNGSAGNFVDEHGSPVSANYQAGGVMVGCPFEDVQAGAYYLDAVLWAYSHEPQITSGTSETTFSPNQFCTRGQIVTFLWHVAGNPVPSIAESPFNDVQNTNAYYYDAILWAYENEITNGVSASNFGVNQLCTRAQVVTFLWRLAGSPEPMQTETSFTDVPANAWYADAVRWAVENEITAGTSPTTFSPGKTCTRAEVVTFLYKYYMGE